MTLQTLDKLCKNIKRFKLDDYEQEFSDTLIDKLSYCFTHDLNLFQQWFDKYKFRFAYDDIENDDLSGFYSIGQLFNKIFFNKFPEYFFKIYIDQKLVKAIIDYLLEMIVLSAKKVKVSTDIIIENSLGVCYPNTMFFIDFNKNLKAFGLEDVYEYYLESILHLEDNFNLNLGKSFKKKFLKSCYTHHCILPNKFFNNHLNDVNVKHILAVAGTIYETDIPLTIKEGKQIKYTVKPYDRKNIDNTTYKFYQPYDLDILKKIKKKLIYSNLFSHDLAKPGNLLMSGSFQQVYYLVPSSYIHKIIDLFPSIDSFNNYLEKQVDPLYSYVHYHYCKPFGQLPYNFIKIVGLIYWENFDLFTNKKYAKLWDKINIDDKTTIIPKHIQNQIKGYLNEK